MSFQDDLDDLYASVYDEHGVDANWSGVPQPVRVQWATDEVERDVRGAKILSEKVFIKVRRLEVPTPAIDDEIETPDGTWRVIGTPRTADSYRKQWICEVVEVVA